MCTWKNRHATVIRALNLTVSLPPFIYYYKRILKYPMYPKCPMYPMKNCAFLLYIICILWSVIRYVMFIIPICSCYSKPMPFLSLLNFSDLNCILFDTRIDASQLFWNSSCFPTWYIFTVLAFVPDENNKWVPRYHCIWRAEYYPVLTLAPTKSM